MNDPYSQQPYNPYGAHDESYNSYQPPTFGGSGAAQIRVKRLILTPTGEYNTQFRRPWVTSYNRDNAAMVQEAVASTLHQHQMMVANGSLPDNAQYEVTPEMLAGISGTFIKPSATTERPAFLNANGGWGVQTARFMMAIEIRRPDTHVVVEHILIGHTNYMGLTQSSAIAHDMEFNINTMFEVRTMQHRTDFGMQTVQRLVKTNQILVDDRFTGDIDSSESIRMRPFEIMSAIQASAIPQLHQSNVSFVDSRILNTSTPVYSNIQHTNPNNYMATVLGGLVSGKNAAHVQGRDGPAHPFHQAAQIVSDNSAMKDPFLTAIRNVNDGALSNKFTFRDLLRLDPNAERDDIATVQWRDRPSLVGARPGENMHVAGTTSAWHGNDRCTQIAAQIANVIPSLMSDLAIRSVSILAGNLQGPPVVFVTNPLSMLAGVDMTPQAYLLQQQVQQQLMDHISFNNQIRYEVNITADLAGEIWISMHLEGEVPYDYVMPAYASSQMSPVMTTKRDTLDNLSTSFHSLQNAALPVMHQPLAQSIGFFNTGGNSRSY